MIMETLSAILVSMIAASTPLLFAAIGELVTEKSGVLNLGVEGMMLVGAVTAFMVGLGTGSPVLAVEEDERIDFSSMFGSDEHFCLRVKGDSMIEDQISEGDYVVVKKQDSCRDGEIVVALVDGQDATLKRFYRESKRIRLEPANSNMKPIFSDSVEIMGVVIGVVRRY